MKILVVAATAQEIEPFIELKTDADILITGVGIPSTIYQLTNKLITEKYNVVIQVGIGGKFSKKYKLGDVVAIRSDAFTDIGVQENNDFRSIFKLGFADENGFPFINGELINNTDIFNKLDIKKVKAVTVNTIHDKKKKTKLLKKRFRAEVESMEGAAFHFVCLQQHVPFIQLRAISNSVGERDKNKWDKKNAIGNLNKELIKLIDSIK